jgi:hypothetical protein
MKANFCSVIVVAALFSLSALASDLRCDRVKKSNDGCFLENSDHITATVNKEKVVVKSGELGELEGTFEKIVKSSGDAQYSAEDLSNFMDQSDLGKIFVSKDQSKIVLSLRFTDDDGPQSFDSCTYRCRK